jgi:hypothetical protein
VRIRSARAQFTAGALSFRLAAGKKGAASIEFSSVKKPRKHKAKKTKRKTAVPKEAPKEDPMLTEKLAAQAIALPVQSVQEVRAPPPPPRAGPPPPDWSHSPQPVEANRPRRIVYALAFLVVIAIALIVYWLR